MSTINAFKIHRLLKCYHYIRMGTRIIKGKYTQIIMNHVNCFSKFPNLHFGIQNDRNYRAENWFLYGN